MVIKHIEKSSAISTLLNFNSLPQINNGTLLFYEKKVQVSPLQSDSVSRIIQFARTLFID